MTARGAGRESALMQLDALPTSTSADARSRLVRHDGLAGASPTLSILFMISLQR